MNVTLRQLLSMMGRGRNINWNAICRAWTVLSLVVSVSAGSPAHGQPPRRSSVEKDARAQLAAADRAFRAARYDEALARVRDAYAIDPKREYLIVFAQVYRAMGDPQRAIDACDLYLSTSPNGPRAEEARGLLAAARAELATPKPTPEPARATAGTDATEPAAAARAALAAPMPGADTHAPAVAVPPRRRRVALWITVGAVGISAAGLALGLGLGLGLPSGPRKLSFDPGDAASARSIAPARPW
jgi:hypothetical protein